MVWEVKATEDATDDPARQREAPGRPALPVQPARVWWELNDLTMIREVGLKRKKQATTLGWNWGVAAGEVAALEGGAFSSGQGTPTH